MVITRDMIKMVNDFINRFRTPEISTVGSLDLVPTEKDKPSNHSSLEKRKTYNSLYWLYTSKKGYRVSMVANTNSMEPMIDSNCILVLEALQGKWSWRLEKQPLEVGQTVTYDTTVGSIVHNLKVKTTWLGKPAWLLQGLNNKLPDMSKVKEDQIPYRLCGIVYCQQEREGD